MPEYEFHCDNCDHSFSVVMSMRDYNATQRCPNCITYDKVHREYGAENVTGRVECRTVGAYADRKSERMSEDEKFHLYKQNNAYRFQPKPDLPDGYVRVDKNDPDKSFKNQKRIPKPKREVIKNGKNK
jgi:putative FmdB family regulatory protein